MTTSEQALSLAREIFVCEERLRDLKAAHARLFTASSSEHQVPQRRVRNGESAPSRILSFMEQKKGQVLTISAIAEGTGLSQLEVGRTVSRLSRNHQIESVGRGEYRSLLEVKEETPA